MQQRITPKFLLENVGQKHASAPMHRLPQCDLGNPRVECQNKTIEHPIVTTDIPSQDIHQVFSNRILNPT